MQLLKRSFIWIKHKFEVGYSSKDFSLRWRLIKGGFSRVCPLGNTDFVDDFVLLWERRDSGCFLVL